MGMTPQYFHTIPTSCAIWKAVEYQASLVQPGDGDCYIGKTSCLTFMCGRYICRYMYCSPIMKEAQLQTLCNFLLLNGQGSISVPIQCGKQQSNSFTTWKFISVLNGHWDWTLAIQYRNKLSSCEAIGLLCLRLHGNLKTSLTCLMAGCCIVNVLVLAVFVGRARHCQANIAQLVSEVPVNLQHCNRWERYWMAHRQH